MKIIKNGRIIAPSGEINGKILVFSDKIIGIFPESDMALYPDAEIINAENRIVSPGLIDLHIHGYLGCDASDGDKNELCKMSDELCKNGVTAFLPTTMTVAEEEIEKAFDAIRNVIKKGSAKGARILGVNAEGPFISPARKGAQSEKNIKKPDASFLLKHKDIIKLSTVAPETEGAIEMIKEVTANSDIVLSIGHSDAGYEDTVRGFDAGIRHATHLFNAWPIFEYRFTSSVGAALADDRVYCEIIGDGFHIHPNNYQTYYRAKQGKIVLITDCTRAGGLPDGEYDLGGQQFTLKGIECRLKDGTVAGSVLKLNRALYNFKNSTSLSNAEIIKLASENPAKILKDETRGTLEKGKRADIVLFDDDFNVKKVFISGEQKV